MPKYSDIDSQPGAYDGPEAEDATASNARKGLTSWTKLMIGIIAILAVILCVLLFARRGLQRDIERRTQQTQTEAPAVVQTQGAAAAVLQTPLVRLTPSPAPTTEETLPIIITNTPTPTPSPSPTASPTPTPTHSPTPRLDLSGGVLKREANLRAQPSGTAKIKKKAPKGDSVTIHEAVTDDKGNVWYFLTLDAPGTDGWMRDYLVSLSDPQAVAAALPEATATPEAPPRTVIASGMANHDANLRETMNGRVLRTIQKGQRVEVYDRRKDKNQTAWLELRAENDTVTGFVKAGLIDLDQESGAQTSGRSEAEESPLPSNVISIAVTNRATNVRQKPQANAPVVRQLSKGTELYVLARLTEGNAEWYEIQTPSGRTHGYVRAYTVNVAEILRETAPAAGGTQP